MGENIISDQNEVSAGQAAQNIAKEIVKNSIRSAICIDDLYAPPYSPNNEGLNFEDPKELFYSFRKHGHCDLDIYQFTDNEEWSKHRYLLHNKDLLIQDWELNMTPGPGMTKFDSTLTILKDIFENSIIPFVVIYTNKQDLGEVSKELLINFNKYTSEDYEIVVAEFKKQLENISNNFDEIAEFLEDDDQSKFFQEYISFPKKRDEIQNEFINALSSFLSVEDPENKKVKRKLKAVMTYVTEIVSLEDAILSLCHICLSNDRGSDQVLLENVRVDIDHLCYSINGTVVLILHKSEVKDDGVKPEDLFNVFSQSITNNPHSIINLISIELKDKFREDFSKIGNSFNTIDESAFLYHAKNYYRKNESTGEVEFQKIPFKNFVVRSWIHELMQKNLDLNLESFHLVEQELGTHSFSQGPKLESSLANYASMVSSVKLRNKENKKLGFGDVFKSGKHYFMCITPHCDCFDPKKINHEFYFIKNIDSVPKTKLKTALEKAEQGFYSFINQGKGTEAVEWACKPFTSFISNEMNESANKELTYSGVSYNLEFVCSLKENYAQRISNNSFGNGYRVGIDLPHLT